MNAEAPKRNIDSERANYLLAFLAMIVGLGTFKDELHALPPLFVVSHWEVTVLWSGVILIGLLFLSIHLKALSLFLLGYNTGFPLARYLDTASYWLAICGLFFLPVLYIVIWPIFVIGSTMDGQTFSQILSLVAALLSAVLAFFAAVKRRVLYEDERLRALEREISTTVTLSQKEINPKRVPSHEWVFMHQYIDLLEWSSRYLKAKGYGVGKQNLRYLATMLHKLGVFEKRDIESAAFLEDLRNKYIHHDVVPDAADMRRAKRIAMELQSLLALAVYNMSVAQSDDKIG